MSLVFSTLVTQTNDTVEVLIALLNEGEKITRGSKKIVEHVKCH